MKNHTMCWIQAALVAICLCIFVSSVQADEELIFESRAPGNSGGGHIANTQTFPGHTFRLTERTRITEIGFYADSVPAERTVFGAIYQVGKALSVADVVTDSRLKATTLITVSSNEPETVSGSMDVILEPGWYTMVFGKGRHGAGIGSASVTMRNTGTTRSPITRGPFGINVETNVLSLVGATTRFFAFGETLPPATPPATAFVAETAGPAASAFGNPPSTGVNSRGLSGDNATGVRLELDRPARLESILAWLSAGSGEVYAAVFPVSGPSAWPPPFTSPSFESAAVAVAALPTGSQWDEYIGVLDEPVLLQPGHYVVALGTDRFGTTGTAGLIEVYDQINSPGSAIAPTSWIATSNSFRVALQGFLPELIVAPDPLDFGDVPQELTATETLTVSVSVATEVTLDAITLDGPDSNAFSVLTEDSSCLPGPIAGESSCELLISFSPDRLGLHEAEVILAGQGLEESYPVAMTATAVPGQAQPTLAPTSIDFDSVQVGQVSAPQTLTLQNQGTASLTAESLSFTNQTFSRTAGDCPAPPFSLSPGQDCKLGIVFEPESHGPASGQISLTFSDSLDPVTAELTAEGIGPATLSGTVTGLGRCQLKPSTLADVRVDITGQTDTQTVWTDIDGDYLATLFADEAPLQIEFTVTGHLPGLREDIGLVANETTVLDVDLVAELGCYDLADETLQAELLPGQGRTLTTALTNTGTAPGTFSIQSSESWLGISPQSGNINPGQSLELTLIVTSSITTEPGTETAQASVVITDAQVPVELALEVVRQTGPLTDPVFTDRFEDDVASAETDTEISGATE